MNHTDDASGLQQGIDPQVNGPVNHQLAMPEGWAAVPVAKLRKSGVSMAGIGLAAAMIMRRQGPSTEERLRQAYSLERLNANRLLTELIIADFLTIAGGIYTMNAGGRE